MANRDNYLMEEILTKLSIKYDLPKGAMRCVLESPFRVLAEQVRGNTMQGVNFNKLGKFAIREDLKKRLIEDPSEVKQKARERSKRLEQESIEYKKKVKKDQDENRATDSDF